MTSQGMLMSKRDTVMVSDKQVTMADGKTYDGIDKIFELSEIHSAGLMFNGLADFENVPIETLVGEFKLQTNFRRLPTIEKIKNKFIKFLSKNTESSSSEEFITGVLKTFKEDLKLEFEDYGFEKTISLKHRREIPSFVKEFSNLDNEFHDIIPDGENKEEFNRIIWEIFSYNLQYEGTGIVMAGFNLKSHYPSFLELNIYCNDGGKIIYEVLDSAIDCRKPFIKVFAINEEAYAFITGVSEDFIQYILEYVGDANESLITNLKWSLKKEGIENSNKIIEIIQNSLNKEFSNISRDIDDFRLDTIEDTSYSIEDLPEWLLCIFAELLIRLTAVKQKVSSDIESVSISTDILILNKINGLKWIKNDGRIV